MTRLACRAVAVAALLLLTSATQAAEPPRIVGVRLGLGDHYKLGCWAPLRVLVEGGSEPLGVTVMAVTPDSDGVGVATAAPGGRPLSTEPGLVAEEHLYVRVGQQNAPIEVQLYAGGRRIDQRVFPVVGGDVQRVADGVELSLADAAVDRLVLQAGSDVGAALLDAEVNDGWRQASSALLTSVAELPRDAVGYDSFDAVVLVVGSRSGDASGGWLGSVTADDARVRALVEWVENGGKLVVSCGAGGANLLEPGGALATLTPGDYGGPSSIAVVSAIERYADAAEGGALNLRGGEMMISSITNPRGQVLAYAGRSAEESPLVVRSPRGFGEVTFVAFDLDAPAVAGWKGRPTLLRRLLGLPVTPETESQNYYPGIYRQDLVNALLTKLDAEFAGVRTVPFLAIVGLVALYLLLIGPGDYFFVKHVLRRVEATWVTFPLLVAATSVAAYYGAHWLKGDRLRVNELEIVDIESATGRTRGALVTHLFSPRAARYDLSLAPQTLSGEPLSVVATNTAWLGKPGQGLGGMQSQSTSGATGVRANYQIDATPLVGGSQRGPTIAGMPVQVWSTKSLVSRYGGLSDRVVAAQLAPDRDGLVEGMITNDTGARLADCRLLYGSWAWKLGDLADGVTTTVDPSVSPLKITTLLGRVSEGFRYGDGSQWRTIEAMAQAMSVGGRASSATDSASQYLRNLDLTHHLDAGRALLLARLNDGPRSELVGPDGPLVSDEDEAQERSRKSWVYARFILDVSDPAR